MKWFSLHKDCINDLLSDISNRYPDKKLFLDVGCGDGSRTLFFDVFNRLLYGVDRINWLKEEAAKKIDFHKDDFVKNPLPYKKEFFDIIFSFDVIEHLPSPSSMLREIRRVLKNDGIFIISTPNRHRLLSVMLLFLGLRKIPYAPDKKTLEIDPYAYHAIEYTLSSLGRLLAAEGFIVLNKDRLFYGITGWYGFSKLFNLPFFHNIVFLCGKAKSA